MKLHRDNLATWVPLPTDGGDLRRLLDDLGIEVKRLDHAGNMTVELLANRGDHHGHHGLAREVAARTGAAVTPPPLAAAPTGDGPPCAIQSPRCLRYQLTRFRRSGPDRPLDAQAQATLAGAGLAAVHPAVDATNVARIEFGQPTHAFDAAAIHGTVVVRESVAGEMAHPLFQPEPVVLPEGTLVIADDRTILAIAGVTGCEGSKVTAATQEIWLESATFDPIAVRRAARALSIATDSSARFERGGDWDAVPIATQRVARLLEDCWTTVGTTDHAPNRARPPTPQVSLDWAKLSTFLGLDLERATVLSGLNALGFQPRTDDGQLTVTVPTWRSWDVSEPADLMEEVARIVGYNAVHPALPPIPLGSRPSASERRRDAYDDLLAAHGWTEVFTDGFHGRGADEPLAAVLPADSELLRHVETTNALDRGYAFLKRCTLPQVLELVAENVRHRTLDGAVFEWTRLFDPLPSGPLDRSRPIANERAVFWLARFGSARPASWAEKGAEASLHHLMGELAALARSQGLDLTFSRLDATDPRSPLLHPGRSAAVAVNGEAAGVVGEVHPRVLRAARIKHARPLWVEMDADLWLHAKPRRRAFREPSQRPAIARDLALNTPATMAASQVTSAVESALPPGSTARVADRFVHEDRTVTLTIAIRVPDEGDTSWTAEDLQGAVMRAVDAVQAVLPGVRLR